MKITEHKEVTRREEVIVGYKCDECGNIHSGDSIPNDWHKFNGHHYSWGNDSHESYEYYMACSPGCYVKLLKLAINEFNEYIDSKIDEFDIEFAKKLYDRLIQKG